MSKQYTIDRGQQLIAREKCNNLYYAEETNNNSSLDFAFSSRHEELTGTAEKIGNQDVSATYTANADKF